MQRRLLIAVFLGIVLGAALFSWLRFTPAPVPRVARTASSPAPSRSRLAAPPTPAVETEPLGNEPVGVAVDAAGGKVYWAEHAAGRIRRANLDGSDVEVVVEGIAGPVGVAIHPAENVVLWTTDGPYPRKVQSAPLDGSAISDLVGGPVLNRPSAIAVGSAGEVYWSESVAGRVRTLGSRGIVDIVDSGVSSTGDRPGSEVTWAQGIAVDDASSQLYWTELISGTIQRIHLDTRVEARVVLASGECDTPTGIAIDPTAGKLYWTDSGCGAILRANLDGSDLETVIAAGQGLIEPRGLALDADGRKLYWADSVTEKIQRANLDGTAIEDLVNTATAAVVTPDNGEGAADCAPKAAALARAYAARKVHEMGICLDKVGAVKAVKRAEADAAKVATGCVARLYRLAADGSADRELAAAITAACPDGLPVAHPLFSDCASAPAGDSPTAAWMRCVNAKSSRLAWHTVGARFPRTLEWLEEVRAFVRTLPPAAARAEDVKATLEVIDHVYATVRDLTRGVPLGPPGGLPASGQRTSYPSADTAVPDDGALRAGARMRFRDNLDGTITDINTNLTWEKKCDCPDSPHDFRIRLPWVSDGDEQTVWDWLRAVNGEGLRGFAGFSDWRIPNAKELISIVNYERFNPAVSGVFDGPLCGLGCTNMRDPQCSCTSMKAHWSSTTFADNDKNAMAVGFHLGLLGDLPKTEANAVRAVRGGTVNPPASAR